MTQTVMTSRRAASRGCAMRKLLPLVLVSLLLSGCDYDLQSESPVIPKSELAMPEDLAGKYWTISQDEDLSVLITQWQSSPEDRQWTIGATGQVENTKSRLVELVDATDYLLISDVSDENVTYLLMQRLTHGIVEIGQLQIEGASPFSEQNLDYARQIAARHGFKLEPAGESRIMIEGSVEGMGIPKLFRDPEFLGALKIGATIHNLPLDPEQAVMEEPVGIASKSLGGPLQLAADPVLSGAQVAQPDGFAGSYLNGRMIDTFDGGLFEINEESGNNTKLALLSFNEEEGTYVGIPIAGPKSAEEASDLSHAGDNEDADSTETESIVVGRDLALIAKQDSGCWKSYPIAFLHPISSVAISGMKDSLMRGAAARHGIQFDGAMLSGEIDGANLLLLLKDGQFTSGLTVEQDYSSTDCPLEGDK